MGQVTITIDRREYAITCDDGQEGHIIGLSRLLDEKAKMLSKSVGLINENMMLAMVALVLADELQELKKNGSGASAEDLKKADESVARSIDGQTLRLENIIKEIKSL